MAHCVGHKEGKTWEKIKPQGLRAKRPQGQQVSPRDFSITTKARADRFAYPLK